MDDDAVVAAQHPKPAVMLGSIRRLSGGLPSTDLVPFAAFVVTVVVGSANGYFFDFKLVAVVLLKMSLLGIAALDEINAYCVDDPTFLVMLCSSNRRIRVGWRALTSRRL